MITLKLGDKAYDLAPLTPRQNRIVVPGLLTLAKAGVFKDGPYSTEHFDLMIDILCAVVDVHRQLLLDWDLPYGDMLQALRLVGQQAGLAQEDLIEPPRPHVVTLEDVTAESVQRLMAEYPSGAVTSR